MHLFSLRAAARSFLRDVSLALPRAFNPAVDVCVNTRHRHESDYLFNSHTRAIIILQTFSYLYDECVGVLAIYTIRV